MEDFLYIGSSPPDEDCAQLGAANYRADAMRECRAYANQLKRLFPKGDFRVKGFEHDFGKYYEVVAYFDEDDDDDTDGRREAAFKAEGEGPMKWDEQSKVDRCAYPIGTVGDLLSHRLRR